jgi:hypothetical protein
VRLHACWVLCWRQVLQPCTEEEGAVPHRKHVTHTVNSPLAVKPTHKFAHSMPDLCLLRHVTAGLSHVHAAVLLHATAL